MSKLVPFDEANLEPTLEELVLKVNEIAKNSQNVYWHDHHVQTQMKNRSVSSRQMFDVLRNGKGIDGPKVDNRGDMRVKLKLYTAGRTVQVVVVVKEDHLIVVTVI